MPANEPTGEMKDVDRFEEWWEECVGTGLHDDPAVKLIVQPAFMAGYDARDWDVQYPNQPSIKQMKDELLAAGWLCRDGAWWAHPAPPPEGRHREWQVLRLAYATMKQMPNELLKILRNLDGTPYQMKFERLK